jgi:hypothetical protein
MRPLCHPQVSTGSYNPIHLQHARMFYLARKVSATDPLESTATWVVHHYAMPCPTLPVVLAVLDGAYRDASGGRRSVTGPRRVRARSVPSVPCPGHPGAAPGSHGGAGRGGVLVAQRAAVGGHPPHRHGLPLCSQECAAGICLCAGTRLCTPLPYHCSSCCCCCCTCMRLRLLATPYLLWFAWNQLLDASFPSGKAPHVLYLCGADHLLMCGPQTLKEYGCICCSRPGGVLRASLHLATLSHISQPTHFRFPSTLACVLPLLHSFDLVWGAVLGSVRVHGGAGARSGKEIQKTGAWCLLLGFLL